MATQKQLAALKKGREIRAKKIAAGKLNGTKKTSAAKTKKTSAAKAKKTLAKAIKTTKKQVNKSLAKAVRSTKKQVNKSLARTKKRVAKSLKGTSEKQSLFMQMHNGEITQDGGLFTVLYKSFIKSNKKERKELVKNFPEFFGKNVPEFGIY